MTTCCIYVEGGGNRNKALKLSCQKAFATLLKSCGYENSKFRVIACGGRNAAYQRFQTAHSANSASSVMLLVDSEDPVADIEQTWSHLQQRDDWVKPHGADDNQVLLMTTCMETWMVADRDTLKSHYRRDCFMESALPALTNLESRDRSSIQNALVNATRACKNSYSKNKRSYELLGELKRRALDTDRLPSFRRLIRILDVKLS